MPLKRVHFRLEPSLWQGFFVTSNRTDAKKRTQCVFNIWQRFSFNWNGQHGTMAM